MHIDDQFNGLRVCPVGRPSQMKYRIRGNKLYPARGGPAEFEIRGGRINRLGDASHPVFEIRGTGV